MKIFFLVISILLATALCAQNEFTTYKNGLIYSETTMNKLQKIVDSLNLKYKSCDLNRAFYSTAQTTGYIISLDTGNVKEAVKDIENNLSLEEFRKKYPFAEIESDVLLVRLPYKDYNGKEIVEYSEVELNNSYGTEIQKDAKEKMKGNWICEYSEKTEYHKKESMKAFFIPAGFSSKPLNESYARRIGYSDCLIDTTSTKFREDAKSGWVEFPDNWQKLSDKKKAKLLEEMRSTKVMGFCSMDSRPREHAIHIALLSAETTNWEVFLKSHLDIMNDRFDRMTDGSYAQAQRQTYIRELEELDINVPELLLGISMRVENPAANHYYGNIGRLGRAITESGNKEQFEKEILAMIGDATLDDYNRVVSYFLYKTYLSYLYNDKDNATERQKLEVAVAKLPEYLKAKVKLK